MQRILTVAARNWDETFSADVQESALGALEDGKVLFLPKLAFPLLAEEQVFLTPQTVNRSKNVSYDPQSGQVGGTGAIGFKLEQLRCLLDRYAGATARLVTRLFPAYKSGIQQGRTSLRPVEIAGRETSWRKDDTRLHVDSFPSMPTAGNRILRVFCNINPENQPRVWRIGEPFDAVARRFWPNLRAPNWPKNLLMFLLRATKSLRTPYDHYMLQLHDHMKEDQSYQSNSKQLTHGFPPGSTWICYTDQVPHAAMSGIHQLEQTYYVPVRCLRKEQSAPLRVLEQLAHRKLA